MADQPDPPQESPESEGWRDRLWKITDHGSVGQVVGGLILAALLGILGYCANAAGSGTPNNGLGTPPTLSSPPTQAAPQMLRTDPPDPTASSTTSFRPSSEPVFTGRLVVGGEKEIDTVPPRSLEYFETGDLYFNAVGDYIKAKDGASLGRFTGNGAPTLAQCDETAQAAGAGYTSFEPKRGDWLCVRTEAASVLAWKITKVDERYLEGDATIWHLE